MPVTREELHEVARQLAELLTPLLPPGVAFLAVVADIGQTGSLAYAANIGRPDAIALLAELRKILVHGGN